MANAKKKKSAAESVVKILLILLIALVIIIALLIFRTVFSENKPFSDSPEQTKVMRNVLVCDENIVTEAYDEQTVNTASDHDVKMNSTWTFADGKSYSKDAYVENPSSNKNAVYFEVFVQGSDEKLYTSPVMPVGSHMENIAFDRTLPAGNYSGTLIYTLLGADGETSIGTLQMAIKIIVQR